MKTEHENFVSGRMERHQFADKYEVAKYLQRFVEENHEVFVRFGPHSDIARRNPESDAHGVWLVERLATIIPNNRRIAEVVNSNLDLFDPKEQVVLDRFGLHARTYDRWVRDEITYEGVVRFPPEFGTLITEMAHVRA
jgi:hypothetical protein